MYKIQKVMVNDIPFIPVTEGVDWFQYNTRERSPAGRPRPIRTPSRRRTQAPDMGVVLTHLTPRVSKSGSPRLRLGELRDNEVSRQRGGLFSDHPVGSADRQLRIPRVMPGNEASAVLGTFRGVNPAAVHALDLEFGVNVHQNILPSYLQYFGNSLTGSSAHRSGRSRVAPRSFRPAVDAWAGRCDDRYRVCDRHPRRHPQRLVARRAARRDAAADAVHRLHASRSSSSACCSSTCSRSSSTGCRSAPTTASAPRPRSRSRSSGT